MNNIICEGREFNSNINKLNSFALGINNDQIKNEKMFFNCSLNFAYENGGEITKSFINSLPHDWKNEKIVFDSRVHMLMNGWYPCIPGWHHDDVWRNPNLNNQPDYNNMPYHSSHILGIVNSDICPTNFALGNIKVPAVNKGKNIYEVWNEHLDNMEKNNELNIISVKDRTLYFFDWKTFHRGTKAINNGFRWFGRVSKNTDRVNNITNEIRINSQVYLEYPNKGW